MHDYLIIDASRQPSQIRCLHCGFAQDLQLPMPSRKLFSLVLRITAEHKGCKRTTSPSLSQRWKDRID